jgi:hypothetical protein
MLYSLRSTPTPFVSQFSNWPENKKRLPFQAASSFLLPEWWIGLWVCVVLAAGAFAYSFSCTAC